jgi:hypothetical protein
MANYCRAGIKSLRGTIRIDLAALDPDPYWECGSGSRSVEIDQNLQISLVFLSLKKTFFLSFVCFLTYSITYFK